MKARTQAAKRRLRRGRPVLPPEDREPNGQKSRRKASIEARDKEAQMNVMSVAVDRRIRHLGLVDNKSGTAEKQAIDPMRGYVLGLIHLDGKLTKRQHDAGYRFGRDMSRYYGLTGVQFPSARAQDLFAIRGEQAETEEQANAAIRARNRKIDLEKILLGVGDINTGRRVAHAIMHVCVLDTPESRCWPDHMIQWVKRGLNKVADYYGMPEEKFY